jgi:hypothetical protein
LNPIDWKNTTTEDMLADPHKFGLPTFQEFCSYPGKWKRRNDESFQALDKGPSIFREALKKIKFFVNGKSLKSIEELEKALGDHGHQMSDLRLGNPRESKVKFDMQIKPVGGGLEHEVHVNIFP